MRVPAHIETILFSSDERPMRRLDDDHDLTNVARDWGVEAAVECGSAGLRPIARLGDDAPWCGAGSLRLGTLWHGLNGKDGEHVPPFRIWRTDAGTTNDTQPERRRGKA